jgi:hypothetical protein
MNTRNFTIFADVMKNPTQPNAPTSYMIGLMPSERACGAMATKHYESRDAFAADLRQRLGYSDRAVQRLLSDVNQDDVLMNHPLTNEDATYLGWHPDYDRH